jgi:hypothetical protein
MKLPIEIFEIYLIAPLTVLLAYSMCAISGLGSTLIAVPVRCWCSPSFRCCGGRLL